GLDHERRTRAVGGVGARDAQCGQDHWRPHLQLPDTALHGGWLVPYPYLTGFGGRAPSGPAPAQARNTPEMNDADTTDRAPEQAQTPAAPDANTIIQFDKVVKRFGDVTVLDHLDFNVQKGEKVTIIGPS